MNKFLIILIIVAATAAVCFATSSPVTQCRNENFKGLENRIKIVPCDSNKCKLPQEANVTVAFQFNPTHKVVSLTNDVYAVIAGISLPFAGTSGTTACGDVRFADTDKPAACPLEPGIEYVYENVFYVYPIYPITDLLVHWALVDADKRQVICFEVPAAIVRPKNKAE